MMGIIFVWRTCGAWWQTAILPVDGNNFPETICNYLVISFLQLMSCNLEMLKAWLLTTGFQLSRKTLGSWFANQRSRQMWLLLGLLVWNRACLHLRAALLCGALHLPAAYYSPSCAWKVGCVHLWIKHGWVAPPFHLRLFRFGVVQWAWRM